MKEYIILLVVLLVAFIAAMFGLNYLLTKFEKDDAKREAISKAKDLCEKLLTQVAFALLTEAERKYGSGTGQLKFSTVMAQFLAMLPDWVKETVDTEWLGARVEALLDEAKELWEKNDKLVG